MVSVKQEEEEKGKKDRCILHIYETNNLSFFEEDLLLS